MSVTVKLSKEISTHKGPVAELTLNEPTAGSFVRHGEPFQAKIDKDGAIDMKFDNKAMLAFLADMTGVDTIILETLPTSDYYALRMQAVTILMGTTAGPNPTAA